MKKLMWLTLAITLTLLLVVGCGSQAPKETPEKKSGEEAAPPEQKEPIKLGAIFDITGATGDVGAPYADGAKNYIAYLNSQGGINGRKIELIDIDYAYKIPQAIEAYNKLVKQHKVVAILGWGTGDTEALVEKIRQDKIPYISGSYSENLLEIETHPYNFLVAPSYSDQIRFVLQWIKDNWTDTSRNPKVAFIYNDTGFGRSPIEDGREFAQKIGVDLVDEEIVDLKALDATSQLLNMKKTEPDFAILQETSNATATVLKDAKKLGLTTQFIGLNWAADEKVVELAGNAAEGYIGVIPFAFPYEDLPAIQEIKNWVESNGGNWAEKNQKFIQGWVSAAVMAEGMKRAGDDITGEGIQKGLESIKNFDLGGLASPVSFSAESHRGALKARLYQVKDGKFVPLTDWMSLPER
ncbi:ABC transporter substrate-binding protein [Calderihabitans maritimus]|uniref:ABC transporter substrate-binding protein n=1 Tax=Calderihabitans maritimus TaxID=1246530 RepID=UPI00192D0D39